MALTISEQIDAAVNSLKVLFKDTEPIPPVPEGATVESLWRQIQIMERTKNRQKPEVEKAARLLLENPDIAELPIPMLAEIIREVYAAYGIKCNCSESSLRWYQSQRGLEWSIVRRKQPRIEVKADVGQPSDTSSAGEGTDLTGQSIPDKSSEG